MESVLESLGTVDKAIDVLFHLHGEPGPRGVTAIGRALGLPKSSAHRLLAALSRRGLVERDEGGGYRPGIGLVALGLGALRREPVVAAAAPVLAAEAEALGETVFLVAARAGRIVVLDKAEGTGFLRAAPQVGSSVPAHATAVGKLYLAFAPDDVSDVPGPLERHTPNTRAAKALAREVAEARQRGFAANRDEWIAGLSACAAPVFHGGKMLAAVAVASSSERMRALGERQVARRVRAAAERIGGRLDGNGAAEDGGERR